MGAFFSGIWAKLMLGAAIVGGLLVLVFRLIKAGGDAERARAAKAAFDHQVKTGAQVRQSDETLADPKSPRAQRLHDRFSRD